MRRHRIYLSKACCHSTTHIFPYSPSLFTASSFLKALLSLSLNHYHVEKVTPELEIFFLVLLVTPLLVFLVNTQKSYFYISDIYLRQKITNLNSELLKAQLSLQKGHNYS